ncbi:hypothetical protein M433DRAFT_158085 [Acidomyces richmondensis BFW]|nr:MAG: hypothetical protein FE78DRAFT_84960 [Acidomyces sp. 'richmondensis']KYG42274.1 hypothetical protein M433DRAFT_158085 [Acidomyces richmondensis BFW]
MDSPRSVGLQFMQQPAKASLPSDLQAKADIEHCLKNGYVVLKSVFSLDEAAEAKAEIVRLSGKFPVAGRNSFEGLKTNRIYSLLIKSRVFDKFTTLPRVLALNDYFLSPGYLISAMHTIQINPGEEPQELHHDDGFCHIPRPRPPLGSAIIVALDDFTTHNGATNLVPQSHLWDSKRRPDRSEIIPAVMEAGSVVYFLATTWHCGGANKTDKPRQSLTVQYCQPYIRQIENMMLAIDPRKIEKGEIPKRIVEMLGYQVQPPFIGYVDGLSPKAGMKRMVKWMQGPVDYNPPTFMHTVDSKL